jgi:hypothetical protein
MVAFGASIEASRGSIVARGAFIDRIDGTGIRVRAAARTHRRTVHATRPKQRPTL